MVFFPNRYPFRIFSSRVMRAVSYSTRECKSVEADLPFSKGPGDLGFDGL